MGRERSKSQGELVTSFMDGPPKIGVIYGRLPKYLGCDPEDDTYCLHPTQGLLTE